MSHKSILVLAAMALLAAGCNKGVSNPPASNNNSNQQAESGTKLSEEPYANYSYLIDPSNLSSDAKLALTGFKMSEQTLASGDLEITLTATKSGYQTQVFDLKSGDHLYFVEKNLKDDNATDNDDATYLDDSGVVVDQNGYVVSTSSPVPPGMMHSSTSTKPTTAQGN